MKESLITEVLQQMLPYLDNDQLRKLRVAMEFCLHGFDVVQSGQPQEQLHPDPVTAFIGAKRIEGCSEKTLTYYRKTIEAMLIAIRKPVQRITTDDIRQYLTTYQLIRKSSKVTIDNIRRILATFYSWLEDEDYIVKSPVRRIHKIKTAKIIKDTYTDEANGPCGSCETSERRNERAQQNCDGKPVDAGSRSRRRCNYRRYNLRADDTGNQRGSTMLETSDGQRSLTLCHYPMLSWKHAMRSYMVHGHIHNDRRADYWPLLQCRDRVLNAGVDINGFKPVTFEEMLENNIRFKAEDGGVHE